MRFLKTLITILVFITASGLSAYLTIHLLIRGENTVVVPELTGKEVIHALEVLTDLGLNTKVKGSEYSNTIPKNHIISQAPDPGSEIKKGRDVRLVISKGARSVTLPNLAGLGLPQARILLEENDLRQGHLSYTFSDVLEKEQVLSQYPPHGANGVRGASVDLLISAGSFPAPVVMPDLRGIHLNQAIEQIEKYGLTTGPIQAIRDPSLPDDIIVEHDPAPGYPVAPGSSIAMTINQTGTGATRGHRNGAVLFRHRAPEGFLKQHVRVSLNRASGTMELFNGFLRPGREIWLLIPESGPSTIFVYLDNELAKTIHND